MVAGCQHATLRPKGKDVSKFVRVQTELREVSLIKQALDDLKLAYGENERYTHV